MKDKAKLEELKSLALSRRATHLHWAVHTKEGRRKKRYHQMMAVLMSLAIEKIDQLRKEI